VFVKRDIIEVEYILIKKTIESTLLLPAACVEPDSLSCSGLLAIGNAGGIHL